MSDNKRTIGAAGSAVGIGTLAAILGTCCVAPWAVGLVGVSGAVTLARLARFQPYFLVVAAVMLAMAFYWAYRPERVCADGTCVTTSRRRLRWVVWIAAVVVAGLGIAALNPSLLYNIH
jgi:hypothetical protein